MAEASSASLGVLSRYFGFIPELKDMHVMVAADSNFRCELLFLCNGPVTRRMTCKDCTDALVSVSLIQFSLLQHTSKT